MLADKYDGKRFNAPNDLVIDRAGGVYFTDPAFRAPKPLPQGKTAVYYLSADGKVTRLIDDLPNPNGVILSPDEKTLYVIPSGQAEMMSYPVEGPGKIGKGKVFCTLKQPAKAKNSGGDGLTVDVKGNLYITSQLGLQVFDKDGKYLGTIKFPEQPANVTFGGAGLQDAVRDRPDVAVHGQDGGGRAPVRPEEGVGFDQEFVMVRFAVLCSVLTTAVLAARRCRRKGLLGRGSMAGTGRSTCGRIVVSTARRTN